MKTLKKITAAVTAVSIASALAGCTPSIGSGTKNALTVGGYDIPAGLFIYYTMQGYSEAAGVLQNNNGAAPELKDVRNAKIDEIDSTDWIQNKATEYCIDYAGIQNEFDAIGGELSQEDKDTAAEMADYYFNQDSRLDKNGVSLETMQKMAESTFKEREIFKYYYGFDGDKGCSEDELKEYFVDNFARVKYVSISLKNEAGEKVAPDKERELRNMAEKYAKQINGKSDVLDKMHEMDAVSEEYDEYVAAHTTTAEGAGAVTTTTTTTTAASDETTTTTTTDPYANERLVQKQTTTSAEQAAETDTETEPAEETDDAKNERLFNDFVFNELPLGEAQVYEYSEDTIYIVLRGDLRERMTEDDYWSEDNIESLQSMRYYEEFTDFLDEKSKALTVEKNKSAYRRYSPFKLELESQTQ
ncbi:MAG: hypothetical protein J6B75_06005 [Ruminococcus sp.]|nr:hypothetical protein [Ruminococcus sp.]